MVEVLTDVVALLVVAVSDLRSVVRCPHRGFRTHAVHDRLQGKVHDLPQGGSPHGTVWIRRRFSCGHSAARHPESHPEIVAKATRRLAVEMVRDDVCGL